MLADCELAALERELAALGRELDALEAKLAAAFEVEHPAPLEAEQLGALDCELDAAEGEHLAPLQRELSPFVVEQLGALECELDAVEREHLGPLQREAGAFSPKQLDPFGVEQLYALDAEQLDALGCEAGAAQDRGCTLHGLHDSLELGHGGFEDEHTGARWQPALLLPAPHDLLPLGASVIFFLSHLQACFPQ